ncbi:unnamed protein product [Closterium sp. NIES-54]
MGLAAPPAPAVEQRGEKRGEGGHKEAAETAAGGAGKGPSAEAIQRLLWTDGEPTAVPASAAAAAPDTAAEPAAAGAAAAASLGDASPPGRGEALDEVKRRLAASMGAAGGDGEARTAAAGAASDAPQELNPPDAKPPGVVAPGANGGAAAASSAPAVRAAPASLLQWSSSDVLHWLRSSVPFRSAPAARTLLPRSPCSPLCFAAKVLCPPFHYAADFEKAGVEGITLVGMTRGHPALANMRPADLVAFEMASQVERRRVVATHAAGQPASELAPRPATAVGVTGMDSQQLRPGQVGQQQHAKLVPPRQFRALHLDGFSSASSRVTTPTDTPHSTDSRILNPVPARPATAAAGSGGAGGQKKGAVSSVGGSGWLFGWSSGAAKDSPASAEAVEVRDEVAAAEEREQTAKAKFPRFQRSYYQLFSPSGHCYFFGLNAAGDLCWRDRGISEPRSPLFAGVVSAARLPPVQMRCVPSAVRTLSYAISFHLSPRCRSAHPPAPQPFCLDHRSYGAHACPDVHVKDVTVAVCPKCSSSFRTSRFEDAERALARHVGGSDCQAASAGRRTKCPVRGCRQRLTTSNRAKCRSCAEDHCLQHRLASDHHCAHLAASSAAKPTRAAGRGAGQRFLDALAKRTGGECAQNSSSGSSSDGANAGLGISPSVQAH